MTTTMVHTTLAEALWPTSKVRWRAPLLVVAGSILLALAARLQVPFWPVPMTMQTFVVLVLAMVYGPRLGVATMLLYLAEGAIGLPVFAGTPEKGIGLAYMVGPTGGYLAGFAVAAILVGTLARRGWDRGLVRAVAAMSVGTIAIFGCGVAWLAFGLGLGVEQALRLGLVPFIPAALLKIALAAVLLPGLWRSFDHRKRR